MDVPFLDLEREWRALEPELTEAFVRFGRAARYVLGSGVAQFEEAFAAAHQYAYAVGVGSGLSALEIALLAEEVGPGDEVITVGNSAVATALAISNIGAHPVFCDVQTNFLIDVSKIEHLITPRTKAIVPVHLFGLVCSMQSISEIAQKHGVRIIEDACQAHGTDFARFDGVEHTKAFSFYPTKNVGGYGEAGMVLTQRVEVRDFARQYRDYGQTSRYVHVQKGTNSRIDGLQCELLKVKLALLPQYTELRCAIAARYAQGLAGLSYLQVPPFVFGMAPHLYVVRVLGGLRDRLQQYLLHQGISTLVHYPTPIHRQPCYISEYTHTLLPVTEQLQEEILSLPCHPYLTAEEQQNVIEQVHNFFQETP